MDSDAQRSPWALFNTYTLKARVAPVVIVLSPLVVAFAIPLKLFGLTVTSGSLGACLLAALTYIAAQTIRAAGVQIEPNLWKSWGGAPSTRFARWQDEKFAHETKLLIRERCLGQFGIALFTHEQELNDPHGADNKITQAFLQIRQILRREAAPESLVNLHNTEYGFLRNLFGARRFLLILALICFTAASLSFLITPSFIALVVALLEMLITAAAIWIGWFVLPHLLKHASDRYAESAWTCFLQLKFESRK